MSDREYVVIVTDALGREWQSFMRTFTEDEIDATVEREKQQLRGQGLGHCKVEKRLV